MPVDAQPTPLGNLALEGDFAAVISGEYTGERYISHFVTCPDAKRWRRRKH